MDNYFYTNQQGIVQPYPQPMPPVVPIIKREPVKIDKRDMIFAAIFAVLSFIIVDFIAFHGLNLGFTLSFFLLFIAVTVYLFDKSNKPSVFSVICGGLSLTGAVSFTLYHDYFINFVMLIIVLGLFTIYTCGISSDFRHREGSFRIMIDMLSDLFYRPFDNFIPIKNGFTEKTKNKSGIRNVLIGVLISIPVAAAIIPLLISSDEAFGSLVSLILGNIGIYLVELVMAVFVFAYLVLYFVTKRKKPNFPKVSTKQYKGVIPTTVSITLLTVISVIYLTYLFSQLAYFFSAFSGILPEGYKMTESEFARRGFFEMFAICVINMLVITLVTALTKRTEKRSVALKLISSFIMLFTVLLLVTSIAKMKLNIEIFGLSKNRILVCAFMLMMLVTIVFYIVHIIKPKISYMQSVVVICSAIFIALAFCNIDAKIAEYNINAFKNNKIASLDVDYLSELSESAVPYIINDSADMPLRTRYFIYESVHSHDSDNDFREYNYTVDKAVSCCKDYYNSLSPKQQKEFDENVEETYPEYYFEDDEY